MVGASIFVFALAAGAGFTLAVRSGMRKRVTFVQSLAHASLGVGAMVLLALRVFGGPKVLLFNDALLVFALVLIAGLFMLAIRFSGQSPPLLVIWVHGATAVLALSLLVIGYVQA